MLSNLPTDPAELRQRLIEVEQDLAALRKKLDELQTGSRRERLPATRQSLTHKFNVAQHEGYMTVGLFEDGRPGELFLTMAKEGSTIGGLMDTIGILTSLALQHGVPVETLVRKFEHVSFEPNGWTRNPTIRRASSVIDYVFRWLGVQFSEDCRREKLAVYSDATTPPDRAPSITTDETTELSTTDTACAGDSQEQIRS